MFNIGLIELLIIVFFSLIFIRPEDIPKIAKNAGLFYRKINTYIFNLKYELSNFEFEDNKPKKRTKKNKTDNI